MMSVSGDFFQVGDLSQRTKAWVAKVRARTHVCDVRSHVCVRNDFSNMCAICGRAGPFKLVTHHTRATAPVVNYHFFHNFSAIFQQCFNNFSTFLRVFHNRIECSKAGKDVLKQERTF